MPKVFVTQETNYDFSPAEAYGEIVFITNDDVNNINGSIHNISLMQQIRRCLHQFNQDEDFVIISGSPYVAALAFMVLGLKGRTNIKFLRWSNRDKTYTPISVDLRIPLTREGEAT